MQFAIHTSKLLLINSDSDVIFLWYRNYVNPVADNKLTVPDDSIISKASLMIRCS